MSHNTLFQQNQQELDEETAAIFSEPTFLQFAPSVPPSQSMNQARNMEAMTFHHNPFQSQDPLISQPMMFTTFPPTSAITAIDLTFTNAVTNNNRQTQARADRRAEHNALERARRENLNSKFQKLAFCLPNLSNDTRPSKSTIIERTLDFVQDAKLKEQRMQNQIEELERVNRYLLSQLDKKNHNSEQNSVKGSRRSSSVSTISNGHSPYSSIPKFEELSIVDTPNIQRQLSSSTPTPSSALIASSSSTIVPLAHDHNKNTSDATVHHAYNQTAMQNLYHIQYDESEDEEETTEINQMNPFAFNQNLQHQQQPYPIIPEQLQYTLMDYSS